MIENSKVFLSQNKPETDKEVKQCVWNMGSPCEGELNNRMMFDGQLQIPLCNRHYIEHVMLMVIRQICDIDVENLVDAPEWSRVELFSQEFGSNALTPDICRNILTRLRGGDKDAVAALSDTEVAAAVIKELPI